MHPVRPVGGLSRARAGNPLVHSAHQPEHDMVFLERKLLLDFDALNQFLCVGSVYKDRGTSST